MKKGMIKLIICFCFVLVLTGAKSIDQNFEKYARVPLGVIEPSSKVLLYRQCAYPLYTFENKEYLPIEVWSQKAEGFNTAAVKYIEQVPELKQSLVLEKEIVYMYTQPVYIGNIRSYALQTKKGCFIPVEALSALGSLKNWKKHMF